MPRHASVHNRLNGSTLYHLCADDDPESCASASGFNMSALIFVQRGHAGSSRASFLSVYDSMLLAVVAVVVVYILLIIAQQKINGANC